MSKKKGDYNPNAVPIALDGGWAWMVLLGSFIAYFIADGWAYSFGVLYTDLLDQFQNGKGKTALIGALLYGVPLVVSPFSCALTNVYGCRIVTIAGGVIIGSSFILSSFAKSVNFLCVTTGVLASIGLSMTYIPAIVIVTYYFEKRRGFATGLAVTGSALGAFACPPLMELLIDTYHWDGTLLIFGAISLNIIVAGALFRPPPMSDGGLEVDDTEQGEQENLNQEVRLRQGSIIMPILHLPHPDVKRSMSTENFISKEQMFKPEPLTVTHMPTETEEERRLLRDTARICNLYANVAISCPDLYMEASQQNISTLEVDESNAEDSTRNKCCHKLVMETKLILSSMLDKSLAKNWCYLLWCASTFITYMWIGVPYVYLVDKVILLDVDMNNAVFLLSIIGIGRAFGQVIFGFLADVKWVNSTVLYTIAVGICGVSTALVPHFVTYPWLAVYSVIFGLFISVTYALQVMCIVDIVGLDKTTSAFGLFQLVQGIGTLLGTPVAGWLFDKTGSYDISFYCAGGWILFSAILLSPSYFMLKQRDKTAEETQ